MKAFKNIKEAFLRFPLFLMEGALGERLKREYELDISGEIAMAGLVRTQAGRDALFALWRQYAATAARHRLPFLATTPTRRANCARMSSVGEGAALLAENVTFLKETLHGMDVRWYAGGLMGCRGDAYTGEGALDTRDAEVFHAWQAEALAAVGADFLMAGIMPTLPEAAGMARAMAATGLPYIISFTIEKTGRLIDGTAISDAIAAIDQAASPAPLFYMANCVHPANVYAALSQPFNRTDTVRERFLGVQANTSPLSYVELDGAANLQTSEPEALAGWMARLRREMGLRVFGGCCGTDARHMDAIARAVTRG